MIARGRFSVAAGNSKLVKLPLTRAGRRLLRKRREVTVRAVVARRGGPNIGQSSERTTVRVKRKRRRARATGRLGVSARTAFTLVTGAGLAAYGAHVAFGFGGEGSESFFQDWVYNALVLSAAVSCLVRGVRVARRACALAEPRRRPPVPVRRRALLHAAPLESREPALPLARRRPLPGLLSRGLRGARPLRAARFAPAARLPVARRAGELARGGRRWPRRCCSSRSSRAPAGIRSRWRRRSPTRSAT